MAPVATYRAILSSEASVAVAAAKHNLGGSSAKEGYNLKRNTAAFAFHPFEIRVTCAYRGVGQRIRPDHVQKYQTC